MKTLFVSVVMMALIAGNVLFANDRNDKPAEPAEPAVVNTSISGVIEDQKTGEALTGVEVRLNGSEVKTYTDFDGKFVFHQVKPGNYSVEAKIISYQPVKRNVKVDLNEMHALNLKLGTVND